MNQMQSLDYFLYHRYMRVQKEKLGSGKHKFLFAISFWHHKKLFKFFLVHLRTHKKCVKHSGKMYFFSKCSGATFDK